MQKINAATGVVVDSWGGYTFEIFTRDGDLLNKRQSDSYSITVRNTANAIVHQIGSQYARVTLGGGNITNKNK